MKLVKSIKQFIQEHPVGVYFFLAYAIVLIGSYFLAGYKALRGEVLDDIDWAMMGLAQFAAPIVSVLFVALIVDGKRGIKEVFRGMRNWQVGKWYLTILIFPVFILVILLILSATVSSAYIPIFGIFGFVGVAAGFIEEGGWMGFAFPRMREKYGVVRTSFYLGFFHGIWHLPLWFFTMFSDLGNYWYLYFTGFVVILIALRIIMGWAHLKTKSLLLSQLIHASSSAFLGTLVPHFIEPKDWAIFYIVYACLLLGFALTLIPRMADSSKQRFRGDYVNYPIA